MTTVNSRFSLCQHLIQWRKNFLPNTSIKNSEPDVHCSLLVEIYQLTRFGHLLTREPRRLELILLNSQGLGMWRDEFLMNNRNADYLVNAEGIISRSYPWVSTAYEPPEWAKHCSEKLDIAFNLLGRVFRRL